MRVVIQRSLAANVVADGEETGRIDRGLVLLVGITHDDEEEDIRYAAEKIVHLRIFEDEEGKMNRSLLDVNGEILSISQFTLYGDVRKGRRPNFMAAAKPDRARMLYEQFNEELRSRGVKVETGCSVP